MMNPDAEKKTHDILQGKTPQEREAMLRMAEVILAAQETPEARLAVAEAARIVEGTLERNQFPELG